MGSISLVSNLTTTGLVDRPRLMTFPLSCGNAGRECISGTGALKCWEAEQTTILDRCVVLLEYRMTG